VRGGDFNAHQFSCFVILSRKDAEDLSLVQNLPSACEILIVCAIRDGAAAFGFVSFRLSATSAAGSLIDRY
jgi:hypothetical protein